MFLYLPILMMMAMAFNQSRSTSCRSTSTSSGSNSCSANEMLLARRPQQRAARAGEHAVATVIGTMAALAFARYRFRGKAVLQLLLFPPITIPWLIIGTAMLIFFFWSASAAACTPCCSAMSRCRCLM